MLAGWLPRDGVRLLRALAGWFELANVDELLQAMAGPPGRGRVPARRAGHGLAPAAPGRQPRRAAGGAGRLGLARPGRGHRAGGAAGDARALGGTGRGDAATRPGRWAAGARGTAAGRRSGSRRPGGPCIPGVVGGALSLLGPGGGRGGHARRAAPHGSRRRARWVLAGISSPGDLWRAEAAWWARVERDGFRLLRTSGLDSGPVLGAVAVLAADAWRVRAALEIAARGGGPLEAYDAVA